MGFMDEYNALKKKRKEEETTNPEASFMDRYNELKQQQAEPINLDDIYYDDNVRPEDMTIEQLRSMYHHIAPKKLKYDLYNFAQLPLLLNKDIPNISEYERKVYQLARENGIGEPEDEPVKKRTWFDAGPFSDGYDFGDISKSILGTIGDIKDDAVEGVVGMVEPALDTILYAGGNAFDKAGSFMFGKENWNTMWRMNRWRNGNYIASGNGDSPLQEIISEKIAEDMINEEAVTDVLAFDASKLFMDPEDYSLLGDKSDSLVQSGGQLAATIGLNAVGVPWFATTGVTSFGKELDNAVNQGASLGEAGTSAAITAATEIITEKIFNGISFGGKTLESVTLKPLIDKISNKTVRTLVKFGLDIGGEGVEEILAGYGSAIGQKLTYADEKELNELFSKEDRWESFIGGMVLSMGGNGVTLHNSIKNGVDYVSGMTANEEAVVNKETEKRIAELEKDGNKLKPSEKSKIKERVLNDLKKGFVSTDTIEEVLGGETYNTYKDTVDSEDAQIKQLEDQIKELGDAPNTVANSKKFDSLQQQLDELKNNSKRDQLKLQLSDEVFGLVKDSRLSESYNENGRRSQVFEADLTKYDEKQRETVQRAIDSGILNNTNRTHDFVDMVAKVSADKGVLFDFTNNDKLKGSVFAVEGKTVNGYFDKESGTVGVNIDSAKALNTVVGHEITHVLEGTELYDAMKQTLFEYAKSKGEYQSRYDAFVELYKDVKDADIEAELAADLVGDYLFTDADFINHLSTKNRNVFQKIYDELLYLYKIANAGSKEAMQLEKVKKAFEKAYREGGKAQKNTANDGGAKYSIETLPDGKKYVRADRQVIYGNDPDSWSEQVEDYINGKIRKGENISLVAEDGEILTLTANTAGKIASNKTSHGTTMSDEKFYVKANAGVHIDELAQVSVNDNPNKKPKADQDARHGAFAEGGWTYRTAFFHDFDGKYYRLKISAAMGKDGTVVYNIGDIEERSFPKVTGSSAKGGALNGKASSFANVAQNGENVKYSLSDTDGKQLSQEQQEYFKDSKLRDENGNLKVMYHGSQNAGFHVFDARMSDDDTSFFFVDRNDVASSYSGTSETYEAKTIRSSEDMNNFLAEIGYDQYEAVEKNGKFELLENGDHVAWSDTAHGIYEEFCWYEGVGEGDANYKVYLNLTNPLEVDAKGKNWNNVSREFSQEIADRYHSLTAEEKAALQDLTEWGEYGIFKDEMLEARASGNSILASAYEKLGGANANLYDAFSIASDNFSEDAISQFAAKQMNTRDYAQRAKEQGYDGVIFKNIVDIGQYGGTHTPATVAIAFDSNQIKSTANAKPTGDADIRYSLSDSDGRELSPAVQNRFADSKVVDADGRLMSVFHGTATGEFSIFDKSKGSVEGDFGSGFYFTDNEADVSEHYEGGGPDFDNKVARLAEQIEAEEDIDYDEAEQRARDELFQGSHKFEVYLNIKNPAIVGETMLLDGESYMEQYNEEDYDDYDDYLGDVEQLVADDIDNIVLEVERNCDVDDTDGISGILREAYFEGGIGIEELKKKINDLYLEDSNGNLVGNEVTRQIIESLGYDGIIDPTVSTKWNMNIEPGTKHYIVFKPNQIKSVTNQNPTDNPDIHRSLSTKGEKHPIYGNYNVSGKDITLEAGPVSEDVTPVQKTVSEMETVAPVTEETELFPDTPVAQSAVVKLDQLNQQKEALEGRMLEAVGAEDYDAFYQLNNEYEALMQEIEALDQEVAAEDADRINSLTEEDIPPETEANTPPEMDAPYYGDNQTNQVDDPFEDRDWHEVGNRKVKAYMYENPEVKPFFQEEARNLLGELNSTTRGERWYNDQLYYESGGEAGFGGVSRHTSASMEELLDSWGMSYADIEKGLNAIIEDHGAENIAAAKKLEFMLNDRLLNGYKDFYSNGRIPPNQDYINLLNEKQITEYSKESFDALMANADQYAPSVEDDIAPIPGQSNSTETALGNRVLNRQQTYITTEDKLKTRHPQQGVDAAALAPFSENTSGQQTMFEGAEKANETIRQNKAQTQAQILTEEPKVNKKKTSAWKLFKDNFVDKGTVFETMSLKTGNRELQAKWKAIGRAESSAQWFMENGNSSTSSLKSIRDTVEKSGKTKQFYEYLYHRHNVDRMNLENRYADMENKPVFGYDVTSEMSKKEAAKLETENPEFKDWANDVYSYMNHLREKLVDGGVISAETAKLWSEMYPNYVPIRRVGDEGLNINVALDSKRTGVNAPIKKATGGNRDILPLFDTMAMRTEQTFKAIAKNRFGVELKNMLGTTVENQAVSIDESIDSVETELLQEGKDGKNPTFTVFENGEKVTFEITDEMYDTMKPKSKAMGYTNKFLNTANNIRRGLLTEYNPAFMLTNPIKDTQDVLINSQHPAKTYANYPKAIAELISKGQYYQEYMENGGQQNTYFDGESKTFTKEKSGLSKVIGFPLEKISQANNFIERVPRMAEYIASRQDGRSIDASMLDAARVTTDFSAGGDLVRFANRNGFTFLNASVQGAVQQVRNVREAKAAGLKGWAKLAAKVSVAGFSALLLNHLMWDDDEEYEELSDYVKQNYYIVGKYGDGKFVRIPKGRALAVIQNAFEQMENLVTGNDEVDLGTFGELVMSNLAPNNPLENNLIAPITQAVNNKTWYGEDLVPTRLQDLPTEEQYDETTDSISRWLGEHTPMSPYKWNYLLDQYSGAIGDMFLPMITPEAERGNDTLAGNLIAPILDKFTTDGVMKNQNISDFYDKKDELTTNAKASGATEEDVLMNQYMNSINSDLSELYAQKREIQNSDLSDAEKYNAVRDIQKQIVDLTRESLSSYDDIDYQSARDGEYVNIGNRYFKQDDEGEWQKLSDDQVTKYKVTSAAGDASYASDGTNHYRWYTSEDGETEGWRKITEKELERQSEVTDGLGISPEDYWNNKDEYSYAYDHPGKYAVAKSVGGYDAYKGYSKELSDIKSDKDKNGNSISGSRKKKVVDYINGLDADYGEKIILLKSEYPSDDTYNYEIIDYLNSRDDISYSEMETILTELGFKVSSDGTITWD